MRTLNYFAFYACLAQDWKTAHELFGKIGDRWDKEVWTYERRYQLWRDTAAPTTKDFQREPWGLISGVAEGIVRTLAFSPSGKMLAIGYAKGKIVLWDMEEQLPRTRWQADDQEVRSLAFSSDGQLLASGMAIMSDPFPPA